MRVVEIEIDLCVSDPPIAWLNVGKRTPPGIQIPGS